MKILSKYLLFEMIKAFSICLIVFLSIYFTIDFVEKIDNFLAADVSEDVIIKYFIYKVPFVMVQMLPAAALISVIIMTSLMKRKNEITAMRACGLNIFRVFRPIVMMGVLLSAGLFLFSETVVPFSSSKSNEIWKYQVEKQDPNSQYYGKNHIWYKGDRTIYWIRHFDKSRAVMEHPTLYFFNDSFKLIEKIYGERGVWEEGRWRIEKGIIQKIRDHDRSQILKFSEHYVDIPETPATFLRGERNPEEMSYWQLKEYAERAVKEGYDNTRHTVDLHLKIAFPFVMFIMILMGIPIAIRIEKGGTPLAVAIGMGLCFLYMVMSGLARSLGYSSIFPVLLSAWLTNFFFFFLTIYMMKGVSK